MVPPPAPPGRKARRSTACETTAFRSSGGPSRLSALPWVHHAGFVDDLKGSLVGNSLADGDVHVHFTMPMTWHHLSAAAGALGQYPMIHRSRNGVAMQVAFGLLDRGLVELDPTIHTGRRASGSKQVFRVGKAFR